MEGRKQALLSAKGVGQMTPTCQEVYLYAARGSKCGACDGQRECEAEFHKLTFSTLQGTEQRAFQEQVTNAKSPVIPEQKEQWRHISLDREKA